MVLGKNSMLKSCPHFLRGRLRQCWAVALRERHRARQVHDNAAEKRAWKLFGLVLLMLLHRPRGSGSVGRDELAQRADDFAQGHWIALLRNARRSVVEVRGRIAKSEAQEQARRGRAALSRVQQGQVSRARQKLTGADLAPKTFGGIAGQATPSQRHGHSPERDGICARQACAVRSHIVHEVFAQCTLRQCVRSRRMHERDASSVFGRPRVVPTLVQSSRGLCDGRHARTCEEGVHVSHHDSLAEAGWRGARHCYRHFIPSACGQNTGTPIWEGSRSNMRPFPVRPLNAGGHRLRRSCNQGTHGCKPVDDNLVN